MKEIMSIINQNYDLSIYDSVFVKSVFSKVYKLIGKNTDYILKIYSEEQIENIKDTLKVIRFLYSKNRNSLNVIQTNNKKDFVSIKIDDIMYYGVVLTYHKGNTPNTNLDHDNIIKYIKSIHIQMEKYPHKLNYYGKEYYVNRCIEIAIFKDLDANRLIKFKYMGNELYQYIENLPRSFCHGNFTIENIIKDISGQFTIIDFDAANNTSNLIDLATFCDQTDFDEFKEKYFDNTIKTLLEVQSIYRKFTDEEIRAMLAFIPLRHFEYIANIGIAQGIEKVKLEFIEKHYLWIEAYFEYFQSWLGNIIV